MFDITALSDRWAVRRLTEADADAILDLCVRNPQFYRYCGKQPSRALVLHDLRVGPPDTDPSRKYFVGFYDGPALMAVMDLIDGYPTPETAYIGFFMVEPRMQGRGIGSAIVREVCRYLKSAGMRAARLAIDRDNPQSMRFWKKNGFAAVKAVERDGYPVLVAEKRL